MNRNKGGDFTGTLKYAHWNGVSWQAETVDNSSMDCGQDTSIEIDSNGYPHISYVDNENVHLRYARWNGSAWHLVTVDNGYFVGLYGDLALDSNDHGHICYRDNAVGDLKYAWFDGIIWHAETVDSEGSVGAFTSIVLDADENPHISYYDWPDNLKYARWDGSSWLKETVDGGGRHTSLALDENGYPHISHDEYTTTSLKYARWDGSAWQLEMVDNSGDVGRGTALAFDSLWQPHIAYFDVDNGDLDYAWMTQSADVAQEEPVAEQSRQLQNFPNPFSSSTAIHFELPVAEQVNLVILDISGREVRRLLTGGRLDSGLHRLTWDGRDQTGRSVAGGIYLFQIETATYRRAGQMLLLK